MSLKTGRSGLPVVHEHAASIDVGSRFHALNFDVRAALYQLTGTDLTQIHGIGPNLALRLIAECDTDLSRWHSGEALCVVADAVAGEQDIRRKSAFRTQSKDELPG